MGRKIWGKIEKERVTRGNERTIDNRILGNIRFNSEMRFLFSVKSFPDMTLWFGC